MLKVIRNKAQRKRLYCTMQIGCNVQDPLTSDNFEFGLEL